MTTRAEFLSRVRHALDQRLGDTASGDGGPEPVPRPEIDPQLVRTVDPMTDNQPGLIDRFEAAATEVGMVIHRCTDATVGQTLGPLLDELSITTAAVGVTDDDLRQAVQSAVADRGGASIDWRHDREMDAQYDVHVGITDVQAAIAETGSVVVAAAPERGRGLSLVPPVHIALVPADRIVADLTDYFADQAEQIDHVAQGAAGAAHRAAALPTAQCLITGPSKTADIEGILVTGVHGPGVVHILLIDR